MRILQAGLGGWGRNWATEVVPRIPKLEAVGYVDSSPAALKAVVDQDIAPAEDCYEALGPALAATSPDAVLVTANLVGHVPLVREALEAGRHVLVEKPFAPSVAAGRELVALAEARDLRLMVSQNYRFHPTVTAVRDLVRSGELGRVHAVDIDFRRWSPLRAGGRRSPHHDLDEPLLVDMTVHHFDLLRAVLDSDASEIFYRGWNPPWSWFAGPAEGAAVIGFDGGPVVSYRGTWLSPGPITPWSGEWRMEFERGDVTWTSRADRADGLAGEHILVRRTVGGPAEAVPLAPLPLADRAGCLGEFVAAVEAGREPESSGRVNLGTLALLEAAAESAASGRNVPVPHDLPQD